MAILGQAELRRVAWREAAPAALALAVIGALVYGRHVISGGLYNDDWGVASFGHFTTFGEHVDFYRSGIPQRPLYALYQPLHSALFGAEPWLHNAWSLLVGVAGSAVLFYVLRSLSVGLWMAFAVAALVLLFPWADSLRLWPTAANGATGILLFLAGVALALAAFRRNQRVLHALSVAFYVAAILLYESVLGGVVGVVCVYLLAARPKAALVRWAVDLAALAAAVLLFTSKSRYGREPLGELADNVWRFVDQGSAVLARAIFPFAELPRGLVLGAALGVLAGGAAIAARTSPADPLRHRLTASVAMATFGCLAIACGYAVFTFASADDYAPLYEGAQNRVNGFAAIGYALVTVGVWSAAAWLLLGRRAPPRPGLAAGAAITVLAAVAIAWALEVEDHRRLFEASWERQERILATIEDAVPDPAPSTTILSFGHPMNEAYGVPVIGGPEDLGSALRLRYDDVSVRGYGVFETSTITCGTRSATLEGNGFPSVTALYGDTIFVDTATGRTASITSRAACERADASFPRGPTWLSTD